MMRALWRVAAVTAALVVANAASAVTFSGGWTLTGFNKSDPGLILAVDKTSGSFSPNLNVGQSLVFSLFKIWTTEGDVNRDDKVKKPITVAFNFPTLATAGTVTGDTYGVTLSGIAQAGKLTWREQPLWLPFGSGGSGRLTVALTKETFNAGFGGLDEGKGHAARVEAKITYKTAPSGAAPTSALASTTPAPVPLPTAGLLLIAGLGGLGVAARRRQA